MKIGMYTAQLFYNGGVERVIKELFRIAGERGSQCFCLCEYGCPTWDVNGLVELLPSNLSKREDFLREWVIRVKPDVFLFHYVKDDQFIFFDIKVLRACGVKCLAVMHSSFPSPLLLDGDEYIHRFFKQWSQKCDAVVTVSKLDAIWWQALGFQTFHVQNPFVHPVIKNESIRNKKCLPREILWVGRQAPPKKAERALQVFAEVLKAVPGAHLTMVGGSLTGWGPLKKKARKLGIYAHVTFLPEQEDIATLWEQADIHLLTSITESFCLVLAEAKAWGIPSAMFDIPFLELVQSGKGLLIAPQGDVVNLSNQIIELMSNAEQYHQLSQEAKESLCPFNDDAVWSSWKKVFDQILQEKREEKEIPIELKQIVKQIEFAWEDYCNRNLWAIEFTRNWQRVFRFSFRPIAKVVICCVGIIRIIKYRIKALLK